MRRDAEQGPRVGAGAPSRTIEVRAVGVNRPGDYPGVPGAYLDVARKLASPLVIGPPICDELMALLQHLFTEEEASLVRHLGPVQGRTSSQVARAERRPVEQVEPVLRRLAFQVRAISAAGPQGEERYRLLPIMPGMFEMVLIGESLDSLSPWHRRFIELFEALYETGYVAEYQDDPPKMARALTVGRVIEAHPMALPSDRLEVVLDRYDAFGIGQCQCRTSSAALGKGCDRPRGNCTVMGQWAEQGIRDGWLKKASRENVLDVKREAESHGLVTWIMNVESTAGQASCSCCGCCCKAFRTVTEFSVPGVIAPAHFTPRFDLARCTWCGRCAEVCPVRAVEVDARAKTHEHLRARCIGCGLCAVACDRAKAVTMAPIPRYKLPYRSWFSMLLHNAPAMARTAWKVWRGR